MNYYYTDGRERFGPFTIEELRARNITMETLVWREGLVDWVAAGTLEDLQPLFIQQATTQQPYASNTYARLSAMPKSWLVEGVLITIFCCLPFGIVSIILSMKMETLWKDGEQRAAEMLSNEAGRWIRIGFICGIIVWILSIMFMVMVRGIGESLNEQVI